MKPGQCLVAGPAKGPVRSGKGCRATYPKVSQMGQFGRAKKGYLVEANHPLIWSQASVICTEIRLTSSNLLPYCSLYPPRSSAPTSGRQDSQVSTVL